MYDSPHQFTPLLPQTSLDALQEKASKVVQASIGLASTGHASARRVVRELVRSINSYYSNRIEGQGTHPANIERALNQDFSEKPDVAQLQRIALAHIDAERELEQAVEAGRSAIFSDFLLDAHKALYSRLSEADRTTKDGHIVEPGQLRTQLVEVGRHIPPTPESVPRFLAMMDEVYGREKGWERLLIAIACLHHRAAWVHPFFDGNGRSTRLQSHCALWPLSGGLWSTSRGLARAQQDYYAKLINADAPRRGDLDGRGNLTAAGLAEWVDFFLGICEDQVAFMGRMLDLDGMKRRIEALVLFRGVADKDIRPEAILPLYHLFAAGPLTRGEFIQLTGLGERTGRSLLSKLLAVKLITSDSPRGPVTFGLPLDSLHFLLPELYPEANTRNEHH
ncbi:Fic family protein [Herbaspirillum huttiense]|uniref:Fic family protein n=1 Tax=Herbaspirillum huttiense TaxID=863372 RepID=UPI001066F60A|nr:Fic family protein [Herbaspirillum huttiense]QBP73870.1 Fic family protein [Herbaspirillum huttiense]